MLGQNLTGAAISHYKILEKLGGGGMGVVYKAQDLKLDRFVALKFLSPHLSADEDEKKRFIHEAKAASALDHPNICTIHEIGETEDGQLFIAMAYYDGETLKKKVSRGQATPAGLAVAEAVEIIQQVAQGLAKAHQHGIIHRDIKSANVMVTKDAIVKILDFGLAKLAGGTQLTKTGTAMGTVAYMSPEQVSRSSGIDHRTDIWSLGVVLYEMLTGKLPFEGEHEQPIMFGIVSDEPPSVRSLKSEVSVGLEQIVHRALAKEPAERHQNISELLVDLKQSEYSEYSPSVKPKRKAVASVDRNLKKRFHLKWPLAVLALAMIGAALFYLINPLSKKTTQPLDEILLTNQPEAEDYPAFSPDGNMIAFIWWNGEDFDICVKLIGTESRLRLTTYPGEDLCPTWSSDGRYIAFGRRYVDANGRGAIVIVPALGGPERELYKVNWGDYAIHSGLAWSPDGKWLAFAEPDSSSRVFSIFLLAYDTLEKRRLTFPPAHYYGDYCFAFSPDGKRLAILRAASTKNEDIYLVAIAGGEPERLTYFNRRVFGLTWMPDGQEIIFSSINSIDEDDARLWRISASGGEPEPLGVKGVAPTISLKQHRLAYNAGEVDSDLWRVDLNNAKQQKTAPIRLAPSSRDEALPRISPDGRTIVFGSTRTGKLELWKCDSDGRNPVQLTSFGGLKNDAPIWSPAGGAFPSWSPDSRSIAFENRSEDQSDIFIISAAGGSPRRFTTEALNDFTPSWSRDGRWIYFTSNRSGEDQIWKQPVAGGQAVQVTRQGGYSAFESFDGKWVYYSKNGIWRTPVDGDNESLFLDLTGKMGPWAVAEDGIYYGAKTDSAYTIDFCSFATRKTATVAVVPPYWIQSLAVSPDQRWLLFSYSEFEGDLFMVENFR